MATYKVPQDVEADDKLIGPFSFRQFIYLIIVVMAGALAWGLGTLFIGLAIIPLPIMLLFGALALPLRKDQPMEIYLAAIISYYMKPRQRKWDPEGIESMIEITAPRVVETSRTKDISQGEAEQRLSYLADLVDTRGWAIRGVNGMQNTTMNNDVYLEAQSATDVLDTNTNVAHKFDQMMAQSTERMREEAMARMMNPQVAQPVVQPVAQQPAPQLFQPQAALPPVQPSPAYASPVADTIATPTPQFNPYPDFNQAVIQPLNDAAHQAAVDTDTLPQAAPTQPAAAPTDETSPSTSDTELTAGIMNLANNPDLSIETIAHEAKRLKTKAKKASEEDSGEVLISLR